MTPIPISILTGFLGAGKTTLLLNLLPQLPESYKLALLKNEFGDVAIDSQLASEKAISGVRELLNGCICCNLVGQLGEALETLRKEVKPSRIFIETSGSAFPATLAMEVNRIIRDTADKTSGDAKFTLDGVISVIDVENWQGYEDTSPTAKMQARYTDLVILNKWESVSERRLDQCIDWLGDLEVDVPYLKSTKGWVKKDVLLGIDGSLAQGLNGNAADHDHSHEEGHQSEVDVLSVTLRTPHQTDGVDLGKLGQLLRQAPKDEVYRIKGIVLANAVPLSSDDLPSPQTVENGHADAPARYILNWAFGRWTFSPVRSAGVESTLNKLPTPSSYDTDTLLLSLSNGFKAEPVVRMTIITGKYESTKWKKRIEGGSMIASEKNQSDNLSVVRIV